ncbi:MAG: class I SAM-dependent methyltransferase, partial [Chloroflexi bacterium]|nr:class I SAM-dependent methyltransferase [Chloroflexota bacterium]
MKGKRSNQRSIPSSVREFYNVFPFPGYSLDDYESVSSLYTRASPYAHLLNKEMPPNVKVLDAGCGTGQFAAFLSIQNRKVVGIDFSEASVAQARALKEKLNLRNVEFAEGDIFALDLPSESFDYVFCNGVLHHTQDPYGGFKALVGLVKPG